MVVVELMIMMVLRSVLDVTGGKRLARRIGR